MDKLRLTDYAGYSIYDDTTTFSVCVENPNGIVVGTISLLEVTTMLTKDYENRIREIIERDLGIMNQIPVGADDMFNGWPIEKLNRAQSYLKHIQTPPDNTLLEREWFIGVGSKCVGCLGFDTVGAKGMLDHLKSKFHASVRLETNRHALNSLFSASTEYARQQILDANPVNMPQDMPHNIVERPTPKEGWRGFKLTSNLNRDYIRLMGGNNHTWETNSLAGDCYGDRERMIEHIKWNTHVPSMEDMGTLVGEVYFAKYFNDTNSYVTSSIDQVYQKSLVSTKRAAQKNPHTGSNICRCGIYGFDTLDKLYNDAGAEFAVYVRAIAWGTVLVDYNDNFRASDITFTEIWLNREIAAMQLSIGSSAMPTNWFNWEKLVHILADFYQVPVVMAENYDEIKLLEEYQRSGSDYMLELNRTWPNPKIEPTTDNSGGMVKF